jgi:hypothetical protein
MDNEAIRNEAGRILEDPDFQQYYAQEEMFDFWRWLRDILNARLPFEGQDHWGIWPVVGYVFKGVLLLVALVGIGYILYWIGLKIARRPVQEITTYGITSEQRQEAKDKFVKLASEALHQQDYRLAIHYLFLAAVSQVIKESSFHGTEFMTNREIAEASDFSDFGEPGQANRLFHQMVYFDEPRWFGQASVPEQDYRSFQQIYSQFSAYLENGMQRKRHA